MKISLKTSMKVSILYNTSLIFPGIKILKIASEIKIKTEIETFPFEKLDDVLPIVKHGKINGNAVIKIV